MTGGKTIPRRQNATFASSLVGDEPTSMFENSEVGMNSTHCCFVTMYEPTRMPGIDTSGLSGTWPLNTDMTDASTLTRKHQFSGKSYSRPIVGLQQQVGSRVLQIVRIEKDSDLYGREAMIVRKAGSRTGFEDGRGWFYYSDDGGLSQFGAYVDTLEPGAQSSDKHWHENEDEFLYVLAGEVTVIEDEVESVLHPGDAACWPAGKSIAHTVANQTSAPCSYLMVGTRVTQDACHYPESGQTLYTEGEQWRIESPEGKVLKSGRCKSPPGRD